MRVEQLRPVEGLYVPAAHRRQLSGNEKMLQPIRAANGEQRLAFLDVIPQPHPSVPQLAPNLGGNVDWLL